MNVNLSNINLSRLRLGGINLSEIKLGMPSGKGTGGEETFDPASFDEAWTVTGKTNDDEDRATVKNLTGNGNDLMLSNFAFAGDSGYGDYPINIPAGLSVDQPFGTLHFTTSTNYNYTVRFVEASPITIRFKISGLTEGINKGLYIRSNIPGSGTVDTKAYNTNGIHEYSYENETAFSVIFYNGAGNEINFSDFYVEIIPDYEGYLVTDGVDDKIQSSSFELDKDWTIIGDWMLFETPKYIGAGIIKPQSIYVYNTSVGLQFFVNTTQLSFSISGIKSVNAICSDGRIYTNDWSEIINDKVGTVTSSNNSLIMGFNSSNTSFTKMAFKNLAVYDGKVLTKDQCIKAYNYLQTLKEK